MRQAFCRWSLRAAAAQSKHAQFHIAHTKLAAKTHQLYVAFVSPPSQRVVVTIDDNHRAACQTRRSALADDRKITADPKQNETIEPVAKSPEEARTRAYELIYAALPQIIAKCVEKANEGSVSHAKFLQQCAEGASSPAKAKPKQEKETTAEGPAQVSFAQILVGTIAAFDRGDLKSD